MLVPSVEEQSLMEDEYYWLYVYKVAECPAKERHDWSKCPYAHRGERAARRCPRFFGYSAEPCPEYCKKGVCSRGEACPMAHSVFESWLHPSKFRTQLCCFGTSCSRRICFFAHNTSQLRVAAPSTLNPTGPVLRRTQAILSVHQPPHDAVAAVAGAVPAVMPAAALTATASAFALPMQGYAAPPPPTVGAPTIATAPGWVSAVNNWPAAGQQPAVTAVSGMGAAAVMSPVVAAPSVGHNAAVPGVAVSGLAASLQGLNLQQDPTMPDLQPPPADAVVAAQAATLRVQGATYMPGLNTGLATVPGTATAVQAPGVAFSLTVPGNAMAAGASSAGQPVVISGPAPLQYYYVQPDFMGPQ